MKNKSNTSSKNSAKGAEDQELEFMGDTLIKGSSSGLPDSNAPYEGPPKSDNMFNGLPYLGPVKDFKKEDPSDQQPQPNLIAYTKQFLTTDPEHMREYNNVRQAAVMHKAVILLEERVYNPELKGWHVLISWSDFTYIAPQPRRK